MTPTRFNLHQLALELHMTVGQLCDAMTFAEFLDWITFFKMQNKGETPVDWESMSPAAIKAKLRI